MKKILVSCFAALALSCAFSMTLQDCNDEIKSLQSERLQLKKFSVVKYRDVDHPSLAVSKRLKFVEVNRAFVCIAKDLAARNRAQEEWFSYVLQIPQSEHRLSRLKDIEARLVELKKIKDTLLRERRKK